MGNNRRDFKKNLLIRAKFIDKIIFRCDNIVNNWFNKRLFDIKPFN